MVSIAHYRELILQDGSLQHAISLGIIGAILHRFPGHSMKSWIQVQEVRSCKVGQIPSLRVFVRLAPFWLRQQESSWEWSRTTGILPPNAWPILRPDYATLRTMLPGMRQTVQTGLKRACGPVIAKRTQAHLDVSNWAEARVTVPDLPMTRCRPRRLVELAANKRAVRRLKRGGRAGETFRHHTRCRY